MSEDKWCWCGLAENHYKECGVTSDPLVKAVADKLFESWFSGLTVEAMKAGNFYNGEYEIAIEDAKVAVGVFKTWGNDV